MRIIFEIIETIVKIPLIIEFLIGIIIYIFINQIIGNVVADVAKDTICQLPGPTNWMLCILYTNPVIAFISLLFIIIGIGLLFRKKFFS